MEKENSQNNTKSIVDNETNGSRVGESVFFVDDGAKNSDSSDTAIAKDESENKSEQLDRENLGEANSENESVVDKSEVSEDVGVAAESATFGSAQGDESPDVPVTDSKRQKRRKTADKIVTALLIAAVCVLVCVCVLKIFVVGQITVSGQSMMPNFHDGDTVWVSKTATPSRGDVVVFYINDVNKFQALFGVNSQKGSQTEKYIKRVVALAGDKLWTVAQNGDYVLKIETADGELLNEDYYTVGGQSAQFYDKYGNSCDTAYLGELGLLQGYTQSEPYTVPENCIFVLGDNRHNSTDSRFIGAVPLSRLYGVVM